MQFAHEEVPNIFAWSGQEAPAEFVQPARFEIPEETKRAIEEKCERVREYLAPEKLMSGQ
jgi:hypothetical protein|eukprot:9269-Heterococcus_DN1.PRE.2